MGHERERIALRPEQVAIPADHPWNRLPLLGAGAALVGVVLCAILGICLLYTSDAADE